MIVVSVNRLKAIRDNFKSIKTIKQESFSLEIYNNTDYAEVITRLDRAIFKLDGLILKAEVEVDIEALAFEGFDVKWERR